MRIFRARSAKSDLDDITEFYGERNPVATQAMLDRVVQMESSLAEHPLLGREGRLAGTREAVVAGTPLVIVYAVSNEMLQVLRVLHAKRRWP